MVIGFLCQFVCSCINPFGVNDSLFEKPGLKGKFLTMKTGVLCLMWRLSCMTLAFIVWWVTQISQAPAVSLEMPCGPGFRDFGGSGGLAVDGLAT